MLYQLYIDHPPNSKKWVIMLSLVKEPNKILGFSTKPYKTIKEARMDADKAYPTLHWVNGRKAYLKALGD